MPNTTPTYTSLPGKPTSQSSTGALTPTVESTVTGSKTSTVESTVLVSIGSILAHPPVLGITQGSLISPYVLRVLLATQEELDSDLENARFPTRS